MSSPAISDAGRSSLRQILFIRDYLDYYSYLRDSDRTTDPAAPLAVETARLFREEGIAAALVSLLADFNHNQGDVIKLAQRLGLTIDPESPGIKAKDLGAALLKVKDGSIDLQNALLFVKQRQLSKHGEALLSQILYIRDYLDYYVYLKSGDPAQGKPTPLDPNIAVIFREQGISQALTVLLRQFNARPEDVQAAIALFGLPENSTIKAKDLSAAVLPIKHDSTDLYQVLGQLEPAAPAPAAEEAAPTPAAPAKTGTLITWTPLLAQEMDSTAAQWQKATWSNGSPFHNTWQADNISFQDGLMSISLDRAGCPGSCDSRPYASGEYRTSREQYGYGYYEARMKGAAGSGLNTSFFVYAGTSGQPSHQEIDFELLGKDCSQVQINYHVGGQGGHEQMVPLPSDGCQNFHNYGFQWSQRSIIWYVDGQEVARAEGNMPRGKTKIMTSLWAGTGVDGWLGSFQYPGKPVKAEYDWVRYSPLNRAAAPSPQTSPAAASSGRPVDLGSLRPGSGPKGPSGGSVDDKPAPPPAAKLKAPKSAWKDDTRRTALARRLVEQAFKNGLTAEIGHGNTVAIYGAAQVSLEIAPNGKVTVTGIAIITPFSINFMPQSDEEMRAKITRYLARLTFPPDLRGEKTLVHSLVIPQA